MVRTQPDPQFSAPEPISAGAATMTAGALASRHGRTPANALQLLLSALLPGAGHLARGEWVSGMYILVSWGILLGIASLSAGRMAGTLAADRKPIDEMLAIGTLALLIVALWAWALYDLKVRASRPRKLHGDSQWAIAVRAFRKNKLAMAGMIVMILLYVVTLITPLISPYDPTAQGDI